MQMCIAIPMEIISIDYDKSTAQVALSGNSLNVDTSLVDVAVGDYVLVHTGCAIERLTKPAALEILELFDELEELARDEDC